MELTIPVFTSATLGDSSKLSKIIQDNPNSVNLKTKHGKQALHFASQYGQYECVSILLRNGADPNIKDGSGRTLTRSLA